MVWIKPRDYDYTNHGLTDAVKFDTTYPTNRTMLYPNLQMVTLLLVIGHHTATGVHHFLKVVLY